MGGQKFDTSLGGARRDFPETQWTRILEVRSESPEKRAAVVEMMAAEYWRPIYAFFRVVHARSNEDAKDLVQDFFGWMIETDFLSKADPERGRFRAFLRTALNNYLSHQDERARRIKRGGDRKFIALQGGNDDLDWELPDPAGRSPEQVLDETWKGWLLAKALQDLEQEYRSAGRQLHFRMFQEYYCGPNEGIDYQELSKRHGVELSVVTNVLRDSRSRFEELIQRRVSETVDSAAEAREELKKLFGGS